MGKSKNPENTCVRKTPMSLVSAKKNPNYTEHKTFFILSKTIIRLLKTSFLQDQTQDNEETHFLSFFFLL